MRFINATVFTLLASSAAVLGQPDCDAQIPKEEAKRLVRTRSDISDLNCPARAGDKDSPTQMDGKSALGVYAEGVDETSSSCGDVAAGAQEIIDLCTNDEGLTGGSNPARGNGNLIVQLIPNPKKA